MPYAGMYPPNALREKVIGESRSPALEDLADSHPRVAHVAILFALRGATGYLAVLCSMRG